MSQKAQPVLLHPLTEEINEVGEKELCVPQVAEKLLSKVNQNPGYLTTDVHASLTKAVPPSLYLPT